MNTPQTRRISGQGMIEYIIIVAVIAIAAIAAYSFFGQSLRGQVSGMAAEVSGQSAAGGQAAAATSAASATAEAAKDKKLGSYGAEQ
ncbi:MAG: pilus assembly protein [Pseudomonadota bacterium]